MSGYDALILSVMVFGLGAVFGGWIMARKCEKRGHNKVRA